MSEAKTWFVQIDDGTYTKGTPPNSIKVQVVNGKLETASFPSGIVSASISLPLYSPTPQEESIGNSYNARKSALELISQVKKTAKLEGDVDIKVDSWTDKNGVVKSALKYVAYAKKK